MSGTYHAGEIAVQERAGVRAMSDRVANGIRAFVYPGNTMFNTLSNLATDARAGLFFSDFMSGDALLLSGMARVDWDAAGERRVVFAAQWVAEMDRAFAPLAEGAVEYSPFNSVDV